MRPAEKSADQCGTQGGGKIHVPAFLPINYTSHLDRLTVSLSMVSNGSNFWSKNGALGIGIGSLQRGGWILPQTLRLRAALLNDRGCCTFGLRHRGLTFGFSWCDHGRLNRWTTCLMRSSCTGSSASAPGERSAHFRLNLGHNGVAAGEGILDSFLGIGSGHR